MRLLPAGQRAPTGADVASTECSSGVSDHQSGSSAVAGGVPGWQVCCGGRQSVPLLPCSAAQGELRLRPDSFQADVQCPSCCTGCFCLSSSRPNSQARSMGNQAAHGRRLSCCQQNRVASISVRSLVASPSYAQSVALLKHAGGCTRYCKGQMPCLPTSSSLQ